MLRFLSLYALLVLIGFVLLEWSALAPAIQAFCWLLAQISGLLIGLFDSDLLLQGDILRHATGGFALQVTEECSGLSATWLLVSAVLAFQAPWKHKLLGVVLGVLLIQSVNIIRLISLYYIGDWARDWFDTVHHDIWPLIFHLVVLLAFAAWLWLSLARRPVAHAPA